MKNELITTLAGEQGLDRDAYWNTISKTVIPSGATTEQIIAFLAVAKQYGLNPLTKEIYAFPSNGGIQPIVSVDGWLKLANSHPQFDGLETEEGREDGKIIAVKCTIHRKDRGHPTMATEYMAECFRDTAPWKKWPVRMLTNKAMIQAIRRAFSFAGIYDPDEGRRIKEAQEAELTVTGVDDSTAVVGRLTERLDAAKAEASEVVEIEPVAVEAEAEAVAVRVKRMDDFDEMEAESLDAYIRYAAGKLDLGEAEKAAVTKRLHSTATLAAKTKAARALAKKLGDEEGDL